MREFHQSLIVWQGVAPFDESDRSKQRRDQKAYLEGLSRAGALLESMIDEVRDSNRDTVPRLELENRNMIQDVIIGAAGAILATIILTGIVRFTDWFSGLFVPSVPNGAVVAFDRSECPDGWGPFVEGRSRVIVGASNQGDTIGWDENGIPLTQRSFRNEGGSEEHTLSESEMPPHVHNIVSFPWGQSVNSNGSNNRLDVDDGPPWNGNQGTLITDSKGSGDPHNNMPPYIALFLCKKGE